ncbi:MAG TPA: hypothetical protein VK932_08640, partial [Kofleriaceae bacterium]|nr:hypothetical protein [Kofleriaceae bacterium]
PSAAPPRAGAVQPIAFAIPAGKPVADAPVAPFPRPPAPLPPPQISPEGEVAAESEVRIRFSEPMVPVAQVGTVASPPATIAPAIAGTWRWIDTRVLSFTASAPRFPGSSQIVVTVPAGVRAVSGATLGEAVRASVTTRPVQIADVLPRTTRPDGPVAIGLDQRIDPARIAAMLDVRGPDGAALPFRAISLAEALPRWRANPSLDLDEAQLAERLGPHVVVLAPEAAWPAGATAHIVLRPGASSAEGPRVTTRASSAAFRVVAPFTVRGIACAYDEPPRMTGRICPAGGRARLELSNRLLERSLRAGMFQLDGRPVDTGRTMSVGLEVPAGPARTLEVAIGDGLVDVYGQPLVGPRRASFAIGPARHEPILQAGSGLIVLDPRFEVPQWIVRAEAVTSVRIQLYQVRPEDYFAFAAFERGARATPPGRRIADRTHPVGRRSGLELRTDLRPALGAAGLGHVGAFASATAPPAHRGAETRWRAAAWIQVTRLGVAARLDRERIHAWVQDVSPARLLAPRAGIEASIVIEGRPGGARATTDGSGHAAFDLPPRVPPQQPPRGARRAPEPIALLVARDAGDATFTALHGQYERATRSHDAYWYATDDRFTYRPGERVHVKGWVRWTHDGVNPDLALPAPGEEVAYT